MLAELYESSPQTAILAAQALGVADASMTSSQRDAFVTDLSRGVSSYTPGDSSGLTSLSRMLTQAVATGTEVSDLSQKSISSLSSRIEISQESISLFHPAGGKEGYNPFSVTGYK